MTKLIGTLALVLMLVSCGGTSSPEEEGPTAAEQEQAREEAREEALAEAQAVQAECEEHIRPLLDKLQEVDSRLDIGLTFDEYGDFVGDISVEYNKIKFKELANVGDDLACVNDVAVPAENATNSYISSYRIWEECFNDINCSNDSIKTDLQTKWSSASTQIKKASKGLNKLGKPVIE